MSRLSPRFPALHRCIAFVALLAMLVPTWVDIVHHPQSSPPPMSSAMQNCGIMAMGKAADQTPTPPAHKTPVCPICQSLHLLAGGFVAADAPVLAAVSFTPHPFVIAARGFLLRRYISAQTRSRAPPVLV